jgi:hypothetical protein
VDDSYVDLRKIAVLGFPKQVALTCRWMSASLRGI